MHARRTWNSTTLVGATCCIATATVAPLQTWARQSRPAAQRRSAESLAGADLREFWDGALAPLIPPQSTHAGPSPDFRFELSTPRVHTGEFIQGRLVVTNPHPRAAFVGSPAYRGALVDTVEIWFRVADEPSDLEPVSHAMHGLKLPEGRRFVSVPVVIPPGGEVESAICVNGACHAGFDKRGRPTAMEVIPAAMTEPGVYEFFVRYINFDLEARADAHRGDGMDTRIRTDDSPIPLPAGPVLLGPFRVQVVAWPDAERQRAAEAYVRACGRSREGASSEHPDDAAGPYQAAADSRLPESIASRWALASASAELGRALRGVNTEDGRDADRLAAVIEDSMRRASGVERDAWLLLQQCLLGPQTQPRSETADTIAWRHLFAAE